MSATRDEKGRLAAIAQDSWYACGANAATVRYSANILARFQRQTACLELGPAEGLMTETLATLFQDLTCVDGAPSFCESLKARFPQVKVVCALFEDFVPQRRFDTIVLGHVLEHVADPGDILSRVRGWLNPQGRVIAVVPNALSLHRQIAVEMGILPEVHALNETDLHHGHRRVYDPMTLRKEFENAGLHIEVFGGYWIKPVSNRQIEEHWTAEMLEGAMRVGERYPEIAAEIYVVAG
jgi:2-polyprenyl-3-methyl-5-hydroxy-6-metoxy-1,4-benzoquinol methylase